MTNRSTPNRTIDDFPGTIGKTLADSEPFFEQEAHPGDDAPNVVMVLLDDTGFAQFGCFGSDIDTPHVDALAAKGLQFTNYHVTPLCSPTRAALLTGRSQHAVGMRHVSNVRTGFPHQLGHISNRAALVSEVLQREGYATFCTGKWHLAPVRNISAAGPFDQWPLARGFDRYYGFLDGETDQFHPEVVIDNHVTAPPTPSEGEYHFSEDMVDQTLRMINDSKAVRPDRPFFAYVAFGATHAPHQAPASYLEKYRGRYDNGWDVTRQQWFERQLQLGVIAEGTELAPLNPGVAAWEDLPDSHQRFAARLQEAFAAFLDHTDDQIGRLVDGLARLGELDNTILIVSSDNGASQEGGPLGIMNEMKFFNGILDDPEQEVHRLDDIGGPHSHTNYPWGWAQCGNSPFKWYKQNTHEGGVHVPMIVHWPAGIVADQAGTKRDQFVNVSDVVPTIYDLLGVEPPAVYHDVAQLPITGNSFASLLADADAPATTTVQYFEMSGSRALVAYQDASWWKAVMRHEKGTDYDTEQWELYDLGVDASECNDLAAEQPERLADLIELWWSEAARHGALPLDDRRQELFAPVLDDHSPHRHDRRYVYRPPLSPIAAGASPSPGGKRFGLVARVERSAGDDGVLWAFGSSTGGISVFVQNERLVVDYNAFGDHVVVESDIAVPVGACELSMRLQRSSPTSGTMQIGIEGTTAGTAELPLMMRQISMLAASIGSDPGSHVSTRYDHDFAFAGTLHELEINLDGAPSAESTARTEMARQ